MFHVLGSTLKELTKHRDAVESMVDSCRPSVMDDRVGLLFFFFVYCCVLEINTKTSQFVKLIYLAVDIIMTAVL